MSGNLINNPKVAEALDYLHTKFNNEWGWLTRKMSTNPKTTLAVGLVLGAAVAWFVRGKLGL